MHDYLTQLRRFSRNARLYLVHIVGMDVIHGTWSVLFNLYLLAIGFDVRFVGLRVLVGGIAGALAALPAGLISDRIGRKWSFVLGDAGGAAVALISISTLDERVLLITPVIGALFGNLHWVTESAFMAENSQPEERVHLFSVGGAMRTAAAMVGALVAGGFPVWAVGAKIELYRIVSYLGIGLWFLSLVPAIMLREVAAPARPGGTAWERWKSTFSLRQVGHPGRIARLVVVGATMSLGAGFVLPLFNVFFHEGLHAHEMQIGTTFASGSLFLALATFAAPLLVRRLSKVQAVTFTRLAAVPFIFVIGFSSDLQGHLGPALTLAGLGYVLRTVLQNVANPIDEAFGMEILDPGERATAVGFEMTFANLLSSGAAYAGAWLMHSGDFRTPFVLMGGFYLLSAVLFWVFFRPLEVASRPAVEPVPA